MHILSAVIILVLCSVRTSATNLSNEFNPLTYVQYLFWKEKNLNEKVSFASSLRYSRLMQVDLKANNLWRIPEFVTQPRVITCITEIDLSCNSIFLLTNSILLKFGQIRSLNISFNLIHLIPRTISTMKSLHTLDLSHNYLRSLPLSLRECILLLTLKLGSNNFSHFPEVILKLNVIDLEIDHNFLTELPLEISNLENLSVFNCCNNRLIALPPTLSNLRKIHSLDIRNNLISSFSLEIFRMPCMSILAIWGNPCPYVRSIESGTFNEVPDEWSAALPHLLASGKPPPKPKASEHVQHFDKKEVVAAQEQFIHSTPKFSATMAIIAIHSQPAVPAPAPDVDTQ